MRYPSLRAWWAVWFVAFLAVPAAHASAFDMICAEPLHLRTEVHDPISGSDTTIDQYCTGNRVVSVTAGRVAIADYARQELMEIDRDAATFSITSFNDIARAAALMPQPRSAATATAMESRPLPARRSADGRPLDAFEFTHRDRTEVLTIEVAVDRQVALSAAALEALIGAAFPNRRGPLHDAVLRAAGSSSTPGRRMQTASDASLALPVEQTVTTEIDGERLTYRSRTMAVDRELPPSHVVMIPPGSKRVESRLVAVPRMVDAIDDVGPPSP